MDEIGGAIGAIVGFIALVYAVVWLIGAVLTLIAIAAMIAIGVAAVAAPPVGLGVLLRKLLTRRYSLSRRKKWQCAMVSSIAFSLPLMVLLVDSSMEAQIAVAWSAMVLSMSSAAAFLAASAYRQHFAEHNRVLNQASSQWDEECWRYKQSARTLARLDKAIARTESKHGRLLREQESLNEKIENIVENNDPSFCRIKIGHWEHEYASLPAKQIVAEINAVSGEIASIPKEHQATARLQSLFLERQLLKRTLSKHKDAARFEDIIRERDTLRAKATGLVVTMSECKRIQSEKTEKIALLKQQRLAIR